jgi:putative transposase
MKASQFSDQQIVQMLQQAERDEQTIGAVCRARGISETTFYRWRQKFGGMTVSEVQRLRELEKENSRLKRLLAERDLEVDALKELLAKKLTTAEMREAVQFLVTRGLSERRACQLVQVQRSTVQYQARPDQNAALLTTIQDLAQQHPRYGYRRIYRLVRRRGQRVNKKRVQRLWQRAKLQVRRLRRKRRRPKAPTPQQATHPQHVWTYDFVKDRCLDGTPLRILTVMDEFTRVGLAIVVGRTFPARQVVGALASLFAEHGSPAYLRSDNGSEFVALVVRGWLQRQQVQTLYIDPGCPWQNGYEERFNGTVRDECLNRQAFISVVEAQVVCTAYLREYNAERPHSSLGIRPRWSSNVTGKHASQKPDSNTSNGPDSWGHDIVPTRRLLLCIARPQPQTLANRLSSQHYNPLLICHIVRSGRMPGHAVLPGIA